MDGGQNQHRGGQGEPVEQLDQAPDAGPVAIVAPGEVEHVRLRPAGAKLGAEPLAESEIFEVQPEIDRKALSPGLSWSGRRVMAV
jgi:hypothetical protein